MVLKSKKFGSSGCISSLKTDYLPLTGAANFGNEYDVYCILVRILLMCALKIHNN